MWRKHATWFWPFIVVESSPITYHLLAHLAQKFLNVPVTSVASERVFSTAGDPVTARRSCLTCEQVDKLILIKQNKIPWTLTITSRCLSFLLTSELTRLSHVYPIIVVQMFTIFLFDLSSLIKSKKCNS